MKTIGLLVTLLLAMPFLATADVHINVNGMQLDGLEAMVSGIISNSIATSSTGGMVSPGSVSSGDASARVHTIMHSGNGGTMYKTEIKTESNGVVNVETTEKVVPSKIEVHIASTTKKIESKLPLTDRLREVKVRTDVESSGSMNAFQSFWARARSFFGFF